MAMLLDELENQDFALKEEYLKAHLYRQYYEPAYTEPDYSDYGAFTIHPAQPPIRGALTPTRAPGPTPTPTPPTPRQGNGVGGVNTNTNTTNTGVNTTNTYTQYGLSEQDAIDAIAMMSGRGLSQTAIIEELWGVSKGTSKKYKSAHEQYIYLLGRLQ